MKINLSNAGKRFNREWIFRGATLQFNAGTAYAITGPNGSGKSTLLQCVGGMLQLSEGSMEFSAGQPLSPEVAYRHISFCAPYLDVIEEMTLLEFLDFHSSFKNYLPGINRQKVVEILELEKAAGKQIRFYSSGMKQRVKLAQAILFDTSVVLLDEPCSNLDAKGIALYHGLVEQYGKNRVLIVCSNDPVEYRFCREVFSIMDYKPAEKIV